METIFFNNWEGIIRVIITTIIAYILVVILLRFSGKRTLAKMNAFDFIVTIALGSILGAVILNKTIPIAEGLLAIAFLILLRYLFTSLAVRNRAFKNLISSSPTMLFYKQQILQQVLRKERITIDELHKAVREAGFASYDQITCIVLETTGDITVIGKEKVSVNSEVLEEIENIF